MSIFKAHEADFFEKRHDKAVKCLLCPHECTIADGKTGICRVRRNTGGTLFAEGYGRITSAALDPIEKKPLAMFLPGSKIFSIGFYGCNLSCRFCQNYEISQDSPFYRETTPREIVDAALKLRSKGNIGIAYTYNEPLTSYEFVLDCANLSKENSLKNVIVTNGYINTEPLSKLLPYTDAMNIDLKAFGGGFYRDLCGGELEPVKKAIELSARLCHIEVTTLVIPGYNDSDSEIDNIASFLSSVSTDIPLHLTRHHPDYKMPLPAPITKERLLRLAETARGHLKYVFCGNI